MKNVLTNMLETDYLEDYGDQLSQKRENIDISAQLS